MSTVIKGSASGQINLNDTTGSIQLNGSDVLTIDSSGNLTAPNDVSVTGNMGIGTSSPTGLLELAANNDSGVIRNKLTFHDTDSAIGTGQSAGVIQWLQDGGTLGAGEVAAINAFTEGTGGSYSMSFSTGSIIGSGNGNEFTAQWQLNSSGRLYPLNGSLFEGDIVNMNKVDLSSLTTGNTAGSYVTSTNMGSSSVYGTSHSFSYGFTASSASNVICLAQQQNHNNGGHHSFVNFAFKNRSTTGADLVITDGMGSSNVNISIIVIEVA